MSEYQYYEFRTIDRPLTQEEMAELRTLSSRATITPTSLQNVYHYGDFRGDPLKLMERYFDAFVYVANWGTRRFMVRLPLRLLTPQTTAQYATGEGLDVYRKGDQMVLELVSEDEEGGDWEEGEGWLDRLIPIRAELAAGDLRALYLGWLCCVEMGTVDDEAIEPPVPPGLGDLSPALRALVEFLRIDEDLIAVAAERSSKLQETPSSDRDLERWIQGLPDPEKNALLLRLVKGDQPYLRMELVRRFREATAPPGNPASSASGDGRAAAALLAAAEERAELRRREEAERKAEAQRRRAQEQAVKRAAYLEDLATKEEQTWRRVETLIEMKRPAEYDQAVQYLKDLRDVSDRKGEQQQFEARVRQLRGHHARKVSFIDRLNRAKL